MNTLDVIIILCFVPAVMRGVSKGFIQQAAGLLSLVLSVWAAFTFSHAVRAWLAPHLNVSETLLQALSFAVILIGVIWGLHILSALLTKALRVIMLGWLDKLLGIVFSLLVTALVIGLVIAAADALNLKFHFLKSDILTRSVLCQAIREFTEAIFPFLKDMFETVSKNIPEANPLAV